MIPFTAKTFTVLDSYNGIDGMFVEGFLLSDKRNKNGWRATWESIQKYYTDFMGRPGIEYFKCKGSQCDRDHTVGTTYRKNMSAQELYRESNIIDLRIDEKTHTLSAVEHILTKSFAEKIKKGKVKYRSPSLWPISQSIIEIEKSTGRIIRDVSAWLALHIAYVDNPAFGDTAKLYTSCEGHGDKCRYHFKSSSSAQAEKISSASVSSSLDQIPELIMHNNQLIFTSPSSLVSNSELMTPPTAAQGNSRNSCTPCQSKKLNYKYKKIREELAN